MYHDRRLSKIGTEIGYVNNSFIYMFTENILCSKALEEHDRMRQYLPLFCFNKLFWLKSVIYWRDSDRSKNT